MPLDADFPSVSADVLVWQQLADFMHLRNTARTPRNIRGSTNLDSGASATYIFTQTNLAQIIRFLAK
jgi:hypothetical protein